MANKNAENERSDDKEPEEQLAQPLFSHQLGVTNRAKSPGSKAIRKTFKGTAFLANLLPTGTVLAFQILSPALTHQGNCQSIVSKYLTLALLGFCTMSCFFLCFTDSIRDGRGKVRYGLATPRGLYIIDGSSVVISAEEAMKYRMKFMDFFHGFLSMLVFVAVALFDQNVVNCFYPRRSEDVQELLRIMPIVLGVICSLLFLAFPSSRHGIGFPLSKK